MRERIEKILQDKGMTQAEFADLIGVNRSSITHLMTGRNKSSDTVAARTLLAFPDINPNWLSYGEGNMYLDYTFNHTQKSLFEEDEQSDAENSFAHFGAFSSENQMKTKNPIVNNNNEESHVRYSSDEEYNEIRQSTEVSPAISEKKSPINSEKKSPVSSGGKKIKKIVFFYTDKTFEEYYPEGED